MIVQVDIGSAQQFNSPEHLICALQTRNRLNAPDKKNIFALFDNLDVRKQYVKKDVQQYSRDSLLIRYEENDYIEQNKDLKFF